MGHIIIVTTVVIDRMKFPCAKSWSVLENTNDSNHNLI